MASSESVDTTDLFEKDQTEGYRIPALLHIPNVNILLAFAEKRSGLRDEDATKLYMREGTYDNPSNKFQWKEVKAIQSATKEGYRSMNPCPVYEKNTNTIFLFFIAVENHKSEQDQIDQNKNAARLYYVTSADHGQNWSEPSKDLTDSFKRDWATFALGPGHGIQLSNGCLIIPANAHVKESDKQVRVHAFTFFSEDRGKTWQLGSFVSGEECGECQVAMVHEYKVSSCKCCKVSNCRQPLIYCNARSNKNGEKQYRVETFSRDGGKTFTEGKLVKQLVEPPQGCHGSVISFPSSVVLRVKNYSEVEKYHDGQGNNSQEFDIILFSHTTNTKSRNDLGIYLATYSGKSPIWTNPWVISAGKCGYSDLAFIQLPKKNPVVACLFEQGSTNEKISFRLLQIDDIIVNTIKH